MCRHAPGVFQILAAVQGQTHLDVQDAVEIVQGGVEPAPRSVIVVIAEVGKGHPEVKKPQTLTGPLPNPLSADRSFP